MAENSIISSADTATGCNVTTLYLQGTVGIPTKDFELNAMKSKGNWSQFDVETVSDYTDGYKIISTITLATASTAAYHQGTCFSNGDPALVGGLCHVGLMTANTAGTIVLAQRGHNVYWYSSANWSSILFDATKGLRLTIASAGLFVNPDVSGAMGTEAMVASAKIEATWY